MDVLFFDDKDREDFRMALLSVLKFRKLFNTWKSKDVQEDIWLLKIINKQFPNINIYILIIIRNFIMLG